MVLKVLKEVLSGQRMKQNRLARSVHAGPEILALYRDGVRSASKIARELNSRGMKTTQGASFRQGNVWHTMRYLQLPHESRA